MSTINFLLSILKIWMRYSSSSGWVPFSVTISVPSQSLRTVPIPPLYGKIPLMVLPGNIRVYPAFSLSVAELTWINRITNFILSFPSFRYNNKKERTILVCLPTEKRMVPAM